MLTVTAQGKVFRKGKEVKPCLNGRGYLMVGHQLVHRLVAKEFLGDSDLCVHHKDGDRTNNDISNLEYVTYKENEHLKKEHGTYYKRGIHPGVKNGRSKLTEKQVSEIREIYQKGGVTQTELSKTFGVSQRAISKIVRGESY